MPIRRDVTLTRELPILFRYFRADAAVCHAMISFAAAEAMADAIAFYAAVYA